MNKKPWGMKKKHKDSCPPDENGCQESVCGPEKPADVVREIPCTITITRKEDCIVIDSILHLGGEVGDFTRDRFVFRGALGDSVSLSGVTQTLTLPSRVEEIF